jgi:hypothetical protein
MDKALFSFIDREKTMRRKRVNIILAMVIFLSSLLPACQQAAQAQQPQASNNVAVTTTNLPAKWIDVNTKAVCRGNKVSGRSLITINDSRAIGSQFTFNMMIDGIFEPAVVATITHSGQEITFSSRSLKRGVHRGMIGYSILGEGNKPLKYYERAVYCIAYDTA